MKRNVDLTENRFFSNNNLFNGVLTLALVTGEKFPWNVFVEKVMSDDDLDADHQRKAIIAVGNKATRAKVTFYREMDSEDYCDCCGVRMNLKPWDREIGICHKCDNRLQKEQDRCKWRKKEIINNAIII